MKFFCKTQTLLIIILLLGLFFRIYKLESFYIFTHDQDLYSWIVKDILVDKHYRLIGQLTSIDGVFIGPLFYYFLTPFFVGLKMNPLAATIPGTIIGLLTVYSFYWVLKRLFNQEVGLIASFLYSVSWTNAFFDRWIVPTQPTVLWSVWFLYALFIFYKGNQKSFILLAILSGLIWHIHVALGPLLLLIPLVLVISRPKTYLKNLLIPLFIFLILTAPFWFFEIRHDFGQIRGLWFFLAQDSEEAEGLFRLSRILDNAAGPLGGNLIFGYKISGLLEILLLGIISLYLNFKKAIFKNHLLILWVWVVVMLLSQLVSKRGISEYYFANLVVIPILLVSVLTSYLYQNSRKNIILLFIGGFFLVNTYFFIKMPEYGDSYLEKKRVVEYIQNDMSKNNYPCIGVNYIAKFGTDVGFRYLLWWKGVNLIKPGSGAPNYNIVIPWSTSEGEIDARFGSLGVILPKEEKFNDYKVCSDPNNQLLPLLGFTK
ncbi:MAG: hypothetical protein UU73_C0001G0190 [Candidatus Daviesbacteria bacterium GW2011_GWA1_41_61]|uniref:Glycosyltransferase RgtA/B/C/D-like domain-containing protein n=1 Tax=Candidatus Daviesbacteria bacterium GW2011_GWA2_40_9 TaxID=1618424 RepID=A0A0G0X4M0_9BACT|nr:MAG: hypothetical protein UU26_C0006G0028 [Candidatus Daviesbacteria bacterium GW2011_GWC1_40_9]KKR82557.1 MAG: hypothetical protein UU29_C0011G0004 [Candidatus Daviesbacteria bacterium GW2011_GWA2_40_9]KKR93009.1 MAG: hypothetical protein UU44_C0004G0191 [Candidatus Daviesbacteria bacterium GW2011_GWB1_41_15]KKS15553.1 MAG: hypothetical protein UU73_C0001G0190 [Candidatus Daviesbacteria bacterium GW2011_GWA1_41_61]